MLWAAVAYSAGIIAGTYFWRPALWWAVSSAAFTLAALYFARRRPFLGWPLALGALFLAGAIHIQLRREVPRLDTAIQPYSNGEPLEITAHVIRDGRIQPSGVHEVRQTVDIEAEQITTASGETLPVHSRVRLAIYAPVENQDGCPISGRFCQKWGFSSDNPPTFHYGDRLRVLAKLKLPRNFRNPGAFDYEEYLADLGIAAVGSAKAENVQLLPGFTGTRLGRWRSQTHNAIVARIHEMWPPHEAFLLDAMVIGEQAFIDRDARADFQRSGAYHVLVVSGMNISILAFVVFWTLRRLRLHDIPATFLTIGLCAAYAFVTEIGAPVWRATLMCAVYLATRLLYRDRAMTNAAGAAALALLIFDPRQLFAASFQMTFLCVLIVAAIAIPILQRTSQLNKKALLNWDSPTYAALLPPRVAQFRLDLQLISARLARFIGKVWSRRLLWGITRTALAAWEVLFVSAVMQMGLALPMARYFHRATTIGLPANLTVVPLMQLLMPAAAAALAISFISAWVAKIPALIAAFALQGITGTIHGLGGLRLADLRVPMPSVSITVLAVASLLLATLTVRRRLRTAALGIAALFVASFLLAFFPATARVHRGVLEVTSIDVGEGDSELLVTPQGKTLLVDAGGPIGPGESQRDFGEDVVSPYLWTRGLSRLDAVAITHGHSDHIGGMIAVLKNFKPKELWVGLLPPSRALEDVITTAQKLGVKVIRHWEGDEWNFGGAKISVLFPPRDLLAGAKPENNDSMILHVTYGDSSVLLEGDAEKQIERRVAALHHPRADLLKVGHHGSANATTEELVASARPQFAVISVGWGNSFGLPRRETLARLADAGTRVYRTDLEGAITFYLDGHSVTPSVASVE